MAATIRNPRDEAASRGGDGSNKKLTLIDRIDGLDCDVLAAQILPKEDGFISVNDDRYFYLRPPSFIFLFSMLSSII